MVVKGGAPIPAPKHPQLLGHDRVFGRKVADPGKYFREAVAAEAAQEVARRLAELGIEAPADATGVDNTGAPTSADASGAR